MTKVVCKLEFTVHAPHWYVLNKFDITIIYCSPDCQWEAGWWILNSGMRRAHIHPYRNLLDAAEVLRRKLEQMHKLDIKV
jgi:hypothetical protein